MKINYKEIGLKVGLEIHLQLSTRHKLFCKCPPLLEERFVGEFVRKLRPTQSELHQIDPAALFEFQKGMTYRYLIPESSACLVEMDEEPPHPLNMEALKVALKVSRALNARIVNEIQVMRKIVIDGSNTTGFQRTCLIALGGEITVNGKKIPIQTICLEEDAARIISRTEKQVTFALDRLGIPLIEITTAPVIENPDEAVRVALEIGRLVKATGYVKNELGTIRQDVNVSVKNGNVVEVKGIQRLSQLRKIIEFEAQRQAGLIKIAEELEKRGIKEGDLRVSPVDVTDIFKNTRCRIINKLIKEGRRVYAIKLKGFKGLLGLELAPGHRLGKEMAERVRFWTNIKGLFHTDELPNYGISEKEVKQLRGAVNADERDAVVFIVAFKHEAERALDKIIERAIEALHGPPYETRGPKNGKTVYSRPRPGMARMYPETDIPPIKVTEELIKEIDKEPLVHPRVKIAELMKKGLNEQLSWEIYDSRYYDLFLRLVKSLKRLRPTFVASVLTEMIKNLERDGFRVDQIPDEKLFEIFRAVDEGITAKESIYEILKHLSKRPSEKVESIIHDLGLETMSKEELIKVIDECIKENKELIKKLGSEKAFKRIMNRVMSIVRGRSDPKEVADLVKERIHNLEF